MQTIVFPAFIFHSVVRLLVLSSTLELWWDGDYQGQPYLLSTASESVPIIYSGYALSNYDMNFMPLTRPSFIEGMYIHPNEPFNYTIHTEGMYMGPVFYPQNGCSATLDRLFVYDEETNEGIFATISLHVIGIGDDKNIVVRYNVESIVPPELVESDDSDGY